MAASRPEPGARSALPAGTPLLDPGVETVFSSTAARHLPRLSRGPSIPLPPGRELQPPQPQPRPATASSSSLPEPATMSHASSSSSSSTISTTSTSTSSASSAAQSSKRTPGPKPLREIDPEPPEFVLDDALTAGRFASIAYCSRPDLLQAWNCTRCGALTGFVTHRVIYDAAWDLASYIGYYPPWDAIVLSFRGTDSSNWGQWAENMRAWRTDHMYPVPDFPHALIHAGFYGMWTGSMLQSTVTAAIGELMAAHPRARFVAAGHSMGGALAQLAGLEFKLVYNASHTTVYTFGAPRVGNLAYQQLFNGFVDVSWRFTHNRDIVPSVPLQLMGFHHVAREVWEVDVEGSVALRVAQEGAAAEAEAAEAEARGRAREAGAGAASRRAAPGEAVRAGGQDGSGGGADEGLSSHAAGGGGLGIAERKLLLCDGSGEDPSCHSSACYLGLCTSIADHLVYLGLHMYQDSDEC